jgi:hypothetical protein
MAHDKTGELIPYVLQSTLLLLAPVLFAASLYMTLSRIIVAVDGGRFSYIRPRWLTRIFVAGDAFTFLVQASGAGLRVKAGSGDADTNPNLGTNIIVGGLILQIAVFGIFIVAGVSFNRRFRRDQSAIMAAVDIPWQQSLNMVYIASFFIMVRNIFRVAEYAMGNEGYLLSVEWGVYVFDASLMTLTMAWFLWRYPNKLRRSLRTGDSGSGGEYELAGRK